MRRRVQEGKRNPVRPFEVFEVFEVLEVHEEGDTDFIISLRTCFRSSK
jgi:hypothetical protein